MGAGWGLAGQAWRKTGNVLAESCRGALRVRVRGAVECGSALAVQSNVTDKGVRRRLTLRAHNLRYREQDSRGNQHRA